MDCKPNRPSPPGRSPSRRDRSRPPKSRSEPPTPETTDHRRYQNAPSSIGDVFGAPTVHPPSHPSTRRGEGVNVSSADAVHGCRDACTRTRVATQRTSLMHPPTGRAQDTAGASRGSPGRSTATGAQVCARTFVPPRRGHRMHRTGAGPQVLPARLTTPGASGQDGPWRSLARSCHTSLNRPFTVPCPNPVAELLANAANHAGSLGDTLRGYTC